MNIALNLNYDTVVIGGKTVKLNEHYDNKSIVNRFVETVASSNDEAAVSYILDRDYDRTASYIRYNYNSTAAALTKIARIYDTFSVDTTVFGKNVGAGFVALVSEENFAESVELVEKLMYVLGLDKDYRLISRYEHEAVFVIIRK